MTRAAQSESLEQRTQRILQSLFCQSKAYVLRFASSSAVESMFNRFAVSFICALLIFLMPLVENFAAQSICKEEWDKTLRDAEAEGQLTLYGLRGEKYLPDVLAGGRQYDLRCALQNASTGTD